MMEWLAMGGHGVYVWSAYGVSAVALAGMGVWPWLALRRARQRIATATGLNPHAPGASEDTNQPEPGPGGAA